MIHDPAYNGMKMNR